MIDDEKTIKLRKSFLNFILRKFTSYSSQGQNTIMDNKKFGIDKLRDAISSKAVNDFNFFLSFVAPLEILKSKIKKDNISQYFELLNELQSLSLQKQTQGQQQEPQNYFKGVFKQQAKNSNTRHYWIIVGRQLSKQFQHERTKKINKKYFLELIKIIKKNNAELTFQQAKEELIKMIKENTTEERKKKEYLKEIIMKMKM